MVFGRWSWDLEMGMTAGVRPWGRVMGMGMIAGLGVGMGMIAGLAVGMGMGMDMCMGT